MKKKDKDRYKQMITSGDPEMVDLAMRIMGAKYSIGGIKAVLSGRKYIGYGQILQVIYRKEGFHFEYYSGKTWRFIKFRGWVDPSLIIDI